MGERGHDPGYATLSGFGRGRAKGGEIWGSLWLEALTCCKRVVVDWDAGYAADMRACSLRRVILAFNGGSCGCRPRWQMRIPEGKEGFRRVQSCIYLECL